jgi:nucleoside-diphosphate-sugar epimerase
MDMKDKIVLAGGTGFLGKALAWFFAEKEFEVVVLGRSNELPADFPKARLVTLAEGVGGSKSLSESLWAFGGLSLQRN